jgi:hypothetical protein
MAVSVTSGTASSLYLAGTALHANSMLLSRIHPKRWALGKIDRFPIGDVANDNWESWIRLTRRSTETRFIGPTAAAPPG